MIFTPHQILIGSSDQVEWDDREILRVWGRGEVLKWTEILNHFNGRTVQGNEVIIELI